MRKKIDWYQNEIQSPGFIQKGIIFTEEIPTLS